MVYLWMGEKVLKDQDAAKLDHNDNNNKKNKNNGNNNNNNNDNDNYSFIDIALFKLQIALQKHEKKDKW